jgi:lipoate-protein ligase A
MWIDDQVLKYYDQAVCTKIFVPDFSAVILGSANDADLEVNLKACADLGVPVLRRYGGGGTVVLYPGCVVVSIGCWVRDQFNNSRYFKSINQALITALSKEWHAMQALGQAGISDIIFGEKKVAGTSLFRSRNYLLYQASILVDLDIQLVGELLRHPTREPEYRRGRPHSDFLAGLVDVDPSVTSPVEVVRSLEMHLSPVFIETLHDDLIQPEPAQYRALAARLARAEHQSD